MAAMDDAGHFFAFFAAVFGEMTPPTSITAAITSKIAPSLVGTPVVTNEPVRIDKVTRSKAISVSRKRRIGAMNSANDGRAAEMAPLRRPSRVVNVRFGR